MKPLNCEVCGHVWVGDEGETITSCVYCLRRNKANADEGEWWAEEVMAICRYMKITDEQIPGLSNFMCVLIAEATRRGIATGRKQDKEQMWVDRVYKEGVQQGRREAWTEAKNKIESAQITVCGDKTMQGIADAVIKMIKSAMRVSFERKIKMLDEPNGKTLYANDK